MVTKLRRTGMNRTEIHPLSALGRSARFARGFARDESGVMIAFSVFFFLIILIVAGIGVDLMRFEMERTRLQNTLDRAVLAAADLENDLTPTDVVNDYFDKANVTGATLGQINDNSGLNHRFVNARAQKNVPTQFIHMLGFDHLIAPAYSAAEEVIEGIEIALVLDVSGSMGTNNRLVNLRPAAREFVDSVLALAAPGDVTISLIPYSTQVGVGEALFDRYNTTGEHSYSHCIEFATSEFNSTQMPISSAPRQRIMHFDPWSYHRGTTFPAPADALPWPACPTAPQSQIMVMNTNATALKNRITALTAGGNTSIDVGMKWAAALLDPGTQPVINTLIGLGEVGNVNAGRPVAYSTSDVKKVIVVMTDGQNTTEYNLRNDLRAGNSDVYYNPTTQEFSIRRLIAGYGPGSGIQYYWVGDNVWRDHPKGQLPAETGTVQRLTYPELFALVSLAEHAWNIQGPMYVNLFGSNGRNQAWNDWYSTAMVGIGASEKNQKLDAICSAAKTQDVAIYAIGFEAPAAGVNALSSCASSPSHYFDATGTEISDVFQAIATSIAQLRLTQ